MEQILFKGGGYNVFSNMSAYVVEWRGEIWMTTEHAYQAAKFVDEKIVKKIKNARSAYEAKMLSLEYQDQVQAGWSSQKLGMMEQLLREKLKQHPHVRKKLLETESAEIIEDTDDAFWGRGQAGEGENQLGKLWMKLRNEYANGA